MLRSRKDALGSLNLKILRRNTGLRQQRQNICRRLCGSPNLAAEKFTATRPNSTPRSIQPRMSLSACSIIRAPIATAGSGSVNARADKPASARHSCTVMPPRQRFRPNDFASPERDLRLVIGKGLAGGQSLPNLSQHMHALLDPDPVSLDVYRRPVPTFCLRPVERNLGVLRQLDRTAVVSRKSGHANAGLGGIGRPEY